MEVATAKPECPRCARGDPPLCGFVFCCAFHFLHVRALSIDAHFNYINERIECAGNVALYNKLRDEDTLPGARDVAQVIFNILDYEPCCDDNDTHICWKVEHFRAACNHKLDQFRDIVFDSGTAWTEAQRHMINGFIHHNEYVRDEVLDAIRNHADALPCRK